jgi:hypothetical protein
MPVYRLDFTPDDFRPYADQFQGSTSLSIRIDGTVQAWIKAASPQHALMHFPEATYIATIPDSIINPITDIDIDLEVIR